MNPSSRQPVAPNGRVLICVPIVHTPADMGELNESIQRVKVRKLGRKGWERNLESVKNFWTEVEQVAEGVQLDYQRLRIYQDGLPICGHEAQIVTDLAQAGSRNYQLLVRLVEKGATLMGTESTELLLEEYQLARQIFVDASADMMRRRRPDQRLEDSLLKRRDQFIAERINSTLLPGESGLLFIGMLHSVEPWLDKEIHVIHPVQHSRKGGARVQ